MKSLAIFILFVGMVLIIKGYYSEKYKQLQEKKVVIKYVPRSVYESQLTPEESLSEFYKGLFEKTQPKIYDGKININK